MKFLILFLFPIQTFALTCFDSSSGLVVSIIKNSPNLEFQFATGRGYEFIPQFDGPVSVHDLALIKFQTESLKELGSDFKISIPLSACDLKKSASGIFACYQEGKIEGKDLQFSSLTGYRTKQIHTSGEFELQNFRLLIGKEDRFFFSIPFPSHACTGSL